MDNKTERVLAGLKDKKVGIFVDDSNLYHAYQKYGWRIDFRKLRTLFEKHCQLEFINYYIAIPEKSDQDYKRVQNFIKHIESVLTLKQKPLKYIHFGGRIIRKGDVDIEIVLDVVRNIENLDVVIIMSGDSDFLELKNYAVFDKKKHILFVGYEENMAWELRRSWHLYINRIRDTISLNQKKPQV